VGSYEQLRTWQAAHQLVLEVYRATHQWPPAERYGLTVQARRAAVSIPANLAEGVAKLGRREFRRFLDIALGSLSELRYLLQLARDLQYLNQSDAARLEPHVNQTGRMLWKLYQATRKAVD
jgi:four helix bundle protein